MQKADGIGLIDLVAVSARFNVEFVKRALGYSGDEAFPDPGITARSKHIGARTPRVKAADYGNQAGVWRPDAEDDSRFAIARDQMSAHGFVHAIVAALVEEIEILIREQRYAVGSGGRDGVRHFARS